MSSAEDNHWRTAWLRGGRISEVSWIGQDVLVWSSGLHLLFFDVTTGRVRLPKFEKAVLRAGVACVSGHPAQHVFAFAEKEPKPGISVHIYPSLERVCQCEKRTGYAYLATAFTGDYLVSLASIPDFQLTVWSWRTGRKIANVDTRIHDAEQTVRMNFAPPIYAAQVGITSGRLSTWEITICHTSFLTETQVVLPKKALIRDASWCPGASDILAIADRDGHVYLTNPTGDIIKRIVLSQRCAVCTEWEPASIAWFRGGLILRTTFCQIRFYQKKTRDFWTKIWHIKNESYPIVLTSHPFKDDRLFFITREGHIMQIDSSEESAEAKLKYSNSGLFLSVDFINPGKKNVAAINASEELLVIETDVGTEVAKFDLKLEGNFTSMLSHPDYPMLVVSSDLGEVVFLSLLRCCEMKVLRRCRLQRDTLDLMKFSNSGRYMVICQKDKGHCYLFDVSLEHPFEIVTRLDVPLKIVDILLFDKQNNLQMYMLKQTSRTLSIGFKLLHFEFSKEHGEFSKPLNLYYLENYYRDLHYLSSKTSSFAGIPYPTKRLTFFNVTASRDVVCFSVIATGHDVKRATLTSDMKYLVTGGLDGTVIVRSTDVKNGKSMHFFTHHGYDLGVRKAIYHDNVLISLGEDGSLVCLKHFEEQTFQTGDPFLNFREFCFIDRENCGDTTTEYMKMFDENIIKYLTRSLPCFEGTEDLSWIEWKKQQRIEEEKASCIEEKEDLVMQLNMLKNRITDLLNKNENSSQYEKLPISEFALNKSYMERRKKIAKDEREEVKRKSEFDSLEMERVANFIKENYWEPQRVLAQSIFGLFSNTEVTNYTVSADDFKGHDFFKFGQFSRNVIKELTNEDTIYPWESYTKSELNLKLQELSKLKIIDESKNAEIIEDLDKREDKSPYLEEEQNRLPFEGMTTHQFIKPSGTYYSQFKLYAFQQVLCDNHTLAEDSKRLRLYFNKNFDEMYAIKEHEMNLVHENIDRLFHISSELKTMFNHIVADKFIYPEWKLKEKPEKIIEVTDDELTVRPYISPMKREILKIQAAEAERIRLAQLADDFCERALQVMMDGVLEVHWEDLIKRDPTKPECVELGKNLDEYTDEEAISVKKYEQELENLQIERERYRKLLLTDHSKIKDNLAEIIEKFNSRLAKFHLLKLKVEMSIQQLNLRYVRLLAQHVKKVKELDVDEEIKTKIAESYHAKVRISEKIKVIQQTEQDLHEQYENYSTRDKYIEKKLRNDFPKLGKNAIKMLSFQFKRRPRLALKTTSSDEILDLGKSIVSMHKLSYLTSECLDYIKQLENLDIHPTALVPLIEDSHWQNLVVLRRLKIDQELKLRATTIELEKATLLLSNYSEKLNDRRAAIEKMKEHLKERRNSRYEQELNALVQLVIKIGQMEIPTARGNLADDWANSVVVPKSDIDKVNEVILVEGRKKLRAMELSLEFRKSIETVEWEYKATRMQLDHLGVDLYYARMTNVTREMMSYLKRMREGKRDEKNTIKMERNFEATRKIQKKLLSDCEIKLNSVSTEVIRVRKRNKKLDEEIAKMNLERSSMELNKDVHREMKHKKFRKRIIKLTAERSTIIRKLLQDHEELLRLREERDGMICHRARLIKLSPSDEFII